MILFVGMYDGSIVKISEGVAELKAGRMVIVTDSEGRENEGDLVMVAEDATPEMVNFMATYGRGLICVPLTEERAKKMNLAPMVVDNEDLHKTAFTISVDARNETTTGISAQDRHATIKRLADEDSVPEDFQRPGHIFPLTAKSGGVLVRAGHTEASVDLAIIAGKSPVAVICEIMNEDGSMARMPDLQIFAKKHNIKIITIKDLIEVRRRKEKMVSVAACSNLPTEYGDFKVTAFNNILNEKTHVALTMGDV